MQPSQVFLSVRRRPPLRLLLLTAGLLLLGSGCGLDHYESQMETEQKRVKYLDDENRNLENPLKLPEKKADDKEGNPERDFFFRPPKGISTTPDAKPVGILLRYPSTNANAELQDNIQELLVAVVRGKESTDSFRQSVLQTLRSSFGLGASGPIKSRDVGGAAAGRTVHYDYYELQGAPNQPGGCVYFYRGDSVPGEGVYQVALAFRATPSQPVIASDSPALELSLASLRVGNAAEVQYSRFKPLPPSPPRRRR
jgi:hypothetical protein